MIVCIMFISLLLPEGGVMPPRQATNLFGQWLDTFCLLLGLQQKDIEKLGGPDQSTISRATRAKKDGTNPLLTIENTQSIWDAFQHKAVEENITLGIYLRERFFNAASSPYLSERQVMELWLALDSFKSSVEAMVQLRQKTKEAEELENRMKEMEGYIQRLEAYVRGEGERPPLRSRRRS